MLINEGIVGTDTKTAMKSEMLKQLDQLNETTPDEWERAVFESLTGHRREEVDWEVPDNHAGFVFIDADKPSYGDYFDEALRILHSGGFIVVDNVFWRYKIFKKKITNENAKAIAAFNAKVKSENRVEKVMLSVRDGIYLIRKK